MKLEKNDNINLKVKKCKGINMKKNFKIAISLFLSMIFVLSIPGCSNGKNNSSMGRYVEEKYESLTGVSVGGLNLLKDNKIGMLGYSEEDKQTLIFTSEDGGKTWSSRKFELPKKEEKKTCLNNMKFLNNGKMLISYYFEEENISTSEEEIFSDESIAYEEPVFLYAIVDTEGTIINLDLDFSIYSDDGSTGLLNNNFKCGANGDIFITASSNNEKIVQLDSETFKEKTFMKLMNG